MCDLPSTELLARYHAGDETAAEAIFAKYMDRLTRLARARLSTRLASRTDPEDVVMSAWRSFFVGARAGSFTIQRGGDLWKLLASITMNKLYRNVRHHRAERRMVDLEVSLDLLEQHVCEMNDPEPTPEEAVALADELEAILQPLDSFARRVLELRLQGERLSEIASVSKCSERTVRRALEQIRSRMKDRQFRTADA